MIDSVEAFYQRELQHPERAITAHLPRLRALAADCQTAVEFGVKRGASSSALILGATQSVVSYDLVPTKEAMLLRSLAGSRWAYHIEDSRYSERIPSDLTFFDSLHTYAQLTAELERRGPLTRRYLVFHDVGTFGEIGAAGETGKHSWTYVPGQSCPLEHLGIRPAIDAYMAADPTWRIRARYTDSHGLLVLERR